MPRKAKQNKAITTRLIQISLKLEEFVYMRKPLSAADAAMYVEEIAAYKPLCSKDERSLQVIEKLTRCMTAIIAEQKDLGNSIQDISRCGSNMFENYTQSNCSSPVYSLPDEDRALMTNTFDDDKDATNAKEIDTIDLCQGNEVGDTYLKGTLDTDVGIEMQRAISNLSILDNPSAAPPVACSQSILLNYEQKNYRTYGSKDTDSVFKHNSVEMKKSYGIPNMAIQENPFSVKGSQSISLNFEPNNDMINVYRKTAKGSKEQGSKFNGKPDKCSIPSRAKKNCKANKTKNSIPRRGMKVNNTVSFDSNNVVINEIIKTKDNNNKEKPKRLTNKNKEQSKITTRKRKTASKKHCDCEIKITSNQPTKIALKKNTSKERKPVVETKNTVVAALKREIHTVAAGHETKKGLPYKPLHDLNTVLTTMPKTVKPTVEIYKKPVNNYQLSNSTHRIENELTPMIYNKSVDDDLSWMENIRYVREIAADEHDPELNDLEDSFWDNFTLPSFWNEQDFV